MPRVLHRANLVMGGERNLMLILLLVSAFLVLLGQTLPSFFGGIVLFFVGQQGLRWMASADEQMSQIYFRHNKYRDYYPPRSTPWRSL